MARERIEGEMTLAAAARFLDPGATASPGGIRAERLAGKMLLVGGGDVPRSALDRQNTPVHRAVAVDLPRDPNASRGRFVAARRLTPATRSGRWS
jgi:hypothetical protein